MLLGFWKVLEIFVTKRVGTLSYSRCRWQWDYCRQNSRILTKLCLQIWGAGALVELAGMTLSLYDICVIAICLLIIFTVFVSAVGGVITRCTRCCFYFDLSSILMTLLCYDISTVCTTLLTCRAVNFSWPKFFAGKTAKFTKNSRSLL